MHKRGRLCYGEFVTTETQTPTDVLADHRAFAPANQSLWLARLDERSLPQFNQIVVWTLLGTAAVLAIWPFELRSGERAGFVSLLSWLPDAVVQGEWTWLATRLVLVAGIALWLLNRWLPWSCWLVVIG